MVAGNGISSAALFGRFLMGWPPEPLVLPTKFRTCVNTGDCVAYIGSGASAGCYPSWTELVNSLCRHCGSSCTVEEGGLAEEYLRAAEDAKTIAEHRYYEHIGQVFGRTATRTNLLYDALLQVSFFSYFTTNFDRLLAEEGRRRQGTSQNSVHAYPALDRKLVRKGSIHYLHGIVQENCTPCAGTIVLARSEFEDAYQANSPLMNFLISTLENDPICFIGCRLQEPDMKTVFDICQRHQQKRMQLQPDRSPPPRYIFLAKPTLFRKGTFDPDLSSERMEKDESYYRELGIETVWYTASGNDHSILQKAFEQMAQLQPIKIDYGWDGES